MATDKPKPWFKCWFADDLAHPRLRFLTSSAVGIWHLARCLMYQIRVGGKLVDHNGAALPDTMIARLIGRSPEETAAGLGELLAAKVFQRDAAGAVFCPAVAYQIALSDTNSNNAASGWNQSRSGQKRGSHMRTAMPKPDAEYGSTYGSTSSSGSSSELRGGVGEKPTDDLAQGFAERGISDARQQPLPDAAHWADVAPGGNGHNPTPHETALHEICGGAHRTSGMARAKLAEMLDKYEPEVVMSALSQIRDAGERWGRLGYHCNRLVKAQEDQRAAAAPKPKKVRRGFEVPDEFKEAAP